MIYSSYAVEITYALLVMDEIRKFTENAKMNVDASELLD